MKSKAHILGHPIHPMLVGFPVAFYLATLAAYAIYALNGDMFVFRVGVTANVAGVATAAIAAVPGFIDWAFAIPRGHPAKTIGLEHMILNVSALVLFGIDAFMQVRRWNDVAPDSFAAIALATIGSALTIAAGYLGWKMMQMHHVGVEDGVPHAGRAVAQGRSSP